jgi:hypothetical protein
VPGACNDVAMQLLFLKISVRLVYLFFTSLFHRVQHPLCHMHQAF